MLPQIFYVYGSMLLPVLLYLQNSVTDTQLVIHNVRVTALLLVTQI
jgi:hypothetical protein